MAKQAEIRSTPANNYYWGVCVAILSEELGYTSWEMHEILKHKFSKKLVHLRTKEKIEQLWVVNSTAHMTTQEFEDYLENIRAWALVDLGIMIPLPSEENNERIHKE